MCFSRKKYSHLLQLSINDLTTLSEYQKNLLSHRYVILINDYEHRCFMVMIFFHISHVIVTVGSLIVPALLSIQYTDTKNTNTDPATFSFQIYWTTWVVSLLVTIANGVLTLFKIDKKYYFLHTTLEHLRSEGWQFLELSGRYSGFYTPNEAPTHTNQFLYFCHMVEKIKMHQVEEEYYKLSDSQQQTTQGGKQQGTQQQQPQITNTILDGDITKKLQTTLVSDGLIPPTPLNPILQKLLYSLSGETEKASKQIVGGDVSELQHRNVKLSTEQNSESGDKESLTLPV